MENSEASGYPIKCPFCGSANPIGSAFCQDCGKKFSGEPPAQPTAKNESYQPPPSPTANYQPPYIGRSHRSRNIIIGVVVGILIVSLVFAAVLFISPNNNSNNSQTTPTPRATTEPTRIPTAAPTAIPTLAPTDSAAPEQHHHGNKPAIRLPKHRPSILWTNFTNA